MSPLAQREVEITSQVLLRSEEVEGSIRDYRKPVPTTLTLNRTFSEPGRTFNLQLSLQNDLHPEDEALLTWKVLCANPIVPDDWTLDFPTSIRPGELFIIKLKIAGGKDLPTKPTIRITALNGRQEIGNFPSRGEMLTFFKVPDVLSPMPDCSYDHPDCVTELTLADLGVETFVQAPVGGWGYKKK